MAKLLPLSCLHTPFIQFRPLGVKTESTSSFELTPTEILDFPFRDVTASQTVS